MKNLKNRPIIGFAARLPANKVLTMMGDHSLIKYSFEGIQAIKNILGLAPSPNKIF